MLVIFDCDGVLVDSEIIVNTVFVNELSKLGINITPDEALKKFTGLSSKKIYKILEKQESRIFTEQEIFSVQNNILKELSLNVRAIEDVGLLLQKLQQHNISYCVASSGTLERINVVLETSGLLPFFKKEVIFSSTMVSSGKPAPDLFLYAAHKMNVLPTYCWVIEDSIAGIKAAKAANMNYIAFLGAQHTRYHWYYDNIIKEKPTNICEDMKNVESILQKNFIHSLYTHNIHRM